MTRFAGTRILITGAALGLDAAMAQAYAAEGARLVLVDRTAEDLASIAAATGGMPVVTDLTTATGPAGCVAAAEAALGGIDVLVSNAYAGPYRAAADQDDAGWHQAMTIGLTAPVRPDPCRVARHGPRRSGVILTIGSINSQTPAPAMAAYATVKAGIEGFTRQIAVQYGPQGIRADTLCPASSPIPGARPNSWTSPRRGPAPPASSPCAAWAQPKTSHRRPCS